MTESTQVTQTSQMSALHFRLCGTDDITAGILVESRRNKISQNSGRRRCRRDEPEVARMADVHAVRQKLLLKLFQNVLGRDTVLWQPPIKERPDSFRINGRRNPFLIDRSQVIR